MDKGSFTSIYANWYFVFRFVLQSYEISCIDVKENRKILPPYGVVNPHFNDRIFVSWWLYDGKNCRFHFRVYLKPLFIFGGVYCVDFFNHTNRSYFSNRCSDEDRIR